MGGSAGPHPQGLLTCGVEVTAPASSEGLPRPHLSAPGSGCSPGGPVLLCRFWGLRATDARGGAGARSAGFRRLPAPLCFMQQPSGRPGSMGEPHPVHLLSALLGATVIHAEVLGNGCAAHTREARASVGSCPSKRCSILSLTTGAGKRLCLPGLRPPDPRPLSPSALACLLRASRPRVRLAKGSQGASLQPRPPSDLIPRPHTGQLSAT